MPYDPEIHQRRSIRLRGYDYSQDGAYLLTICVAGRVCALGEVEDGEMRLSQQGEIAARCWAAIPEHFPTAMLGAFVVMPNHLHGLVFLTETEATTAAMSPDGKRPKIGTIVGVFKSASARQINAFQGTAGAFWQRDFYEHIVRSERGLVRLQRYVEENPMRWELDEMYPRHLQ